MNRYRFRMTVSIVAMMLAALVSAAVVPASGLAGQSDATPDSTSPDGLFSSDGVTSGVLAKSETEGISVPEPRLILERLALSGDTEPRERTTAAPELLFVEEGIVSVEDDFGFASTAESGGQLAFNAGASYVLVNDESGDAVVLRLSLSAAGDAEDTEATPSVAGPISTPVANDANIDVLLDHEVENLPSGGSTLFIAEAAFAPGAESGEQSHTGPLGIVVQEGELSVLSPSGVVGQLDAGSGVVLPENAPLVASNDGETDATMLFAGVVETGESLVAEVTPEPTPTVAPTQMPVPTPAAEPTATAVPSPTPEPIPTPEPTVRPTTDEGTILQLGETWEANDATLTVSLDGSSSEGVCLIFAYQNDSNERVDFLASNGAIRVYDDQRNSWEANDSQLAALVESWIILEPGETTAYGISFGQPNGYEEYSANVFVAIEGIGEISSAKWGFTFNNGRVLTIPPDAVDPTSDEPSGSQSDDSSAGSAVQGIGPSGELDQLLPTEDEVPSGLVLLNTRSRALDEVAANYPDPAETEELFTSLGWDGNAIRSFGLPDGTTAAPDGINGIYASIHAFDSSDSAVAALDYSMDAQAAGTPLQEIAGPALGDYSRTLYGPMEYGNEVTLLVQEGNLFLRVSAASLEGDPTGVAQGLMELMLARS